MAPWADALFAMDPDWWRAHSAEVDAVFSGERFSTNQIPVSCKVTRLDPKHFRSHKNSGCGAIQLAVQGGAERVILLGYDCQKTPDRSHWHGDHPKGLGNAGGIDRWPERFRALSDELNGIEIVNSSRESALTMFPRMNLEEALEQVAA